MIKKVIVVFILFSFSFSYSQQKKNKKNPPPVSVEQTSDITKSSKWIEKFKLKGKAYNVYVKHQRPSSTMDQIKTDTLIEYLFALENRKISIQNLQKFVTIKGKIGREGFYKIKGDTLITTVNYYDPYHGGALITKYVPDKYGWFKEVASDMKGIDTDTLSERYIKTEKMNTIYDPKN